MQDYNYTFMKLFNGDAIFLKFFVSFIDTIGKDSPYVLSLMPGMNEGISGTLLTTFNIGIPKCIEENKIKPITEVVRYMTSLEVQKKLVLKRIIVSGITYLYEEEEICNSIQYCEVYKNAQYIIKPVNKTNNYGKYIEKFSGYFFNFLYGYEKPEVVLKFMDDITRIYNITIDPDELSLGFISLIAYIVFSIIELGSLIFIKIGKFKIFFSYLPDAFWVLIVIGIIILSSIIFTKIGDITSFKCHLVVFFLNIGYTLIYTPIFIKLIVSFPDENKLSNWFIKNKYSFLIIALSVDTFLNVLAFIQPFTIEKIIINEGENYEICAMNGRFLKSIVYMEGLYKFVIVMAILILIFVEWNIKETLYDIKICLSCLYMNGIIVIIFIIFNNFKFIDYNIYYGIQICLIFIISLSNYAIIFGIRLILPFFVDYKEYMERIIEERSISESKSSYSNQRTNVEVISSNGTSNKNIYSKLVNYHYRTSNQNMSNKSSNIGSNTRSSIS